MKEDTQIAIIKQIRDNISSIHLVAAVFYSTVIHFSPFIKTFYHVNCHCDNFNIETHFITCKMKSFKDCLPQPLLLQRLLKYNYVQYNLKKSFLFTDVENSN